MDFDTLKKNMLSGKFTTYEEFFGDLQLIWDNCKLYNMAKSEIYKLAERMERMTKRELQKFKQQNGMHSIVLPSSANTTRQQVMNQVAPPKSNKRAANPKNNDEFKGEYADGNVAPAEESNEVTTEMKLEFV